jgi:hypothetical protein
MFRIAREVAAKAFHSAGGIPRQQFCYYLTAFC